MATFEGTPTFQNLLYIVDQSFENIAVAFRGLVPEQKRFEAACALMALLEDDELQANQRVVSLYILYHLYNVVPIHQNPFLLLFLNLYKNLFSNLPFVKSNYELLVEFRVEALILANKGSQLSDKTPTDIFTQFASTNDSPLMDTEEVNIAGFEHYIKREFDVRLPHKGERQSSWIEVDDLDAREISYTPAPQSSVVQEKHIITVGIDSEIEWDYNMMADFTDRDDIRLLMNKALQRALSIPEEEYVLKQFEKNSKLIYHCNFSPEKLPYLIENNSRVAVEALLQLKSSPQIGKYLEALLTINDPKRSQQSSTEPVNRMRSSMEVVNQLITPFPLSPEFLHSYLSNCVRACEECRNRNIQGRQVRLICVFLQSLINKNIIDVNRFSIEIQAFCLQFSRHREAAELFRFLLNLQRDAISEDVLSEGAILNGGGGDNNNDTDNSGEHGANGDLEKCELS
ncbi:13861_t:CDS:2 [Acaulospora morrowiae]|uniref:CCR4-NOT transcription complex subunit 11 n=1 Tax=Acaulospora morrowiae TaxID=94023 RepID=A0A9N9F9X0_9GLOM|nr:13861_t:CDS:2 [Acaulospora morrowiae]